MYVYSAVLGWGLTPRALKSRSGFVPNPEVSAPDRFWSLQGSSFLRCKSSCSVLHPAPSAEPTGVRSTARSQSYVLPRSAVNAWRRVLNRAQQTCRSDVSSTDPQSAVVLSQVQAAAQPIKVPQFVPPPRLTPRPAFQPQVRHCETRLRTLTPSDQCVWPTRRGVLTLQQRAGARRSTRSCLAPWH